MAYKSEAQRRKFHVLAKQGKISKDVLNEYEEASKGKKLPERITPKKVTPPKIRSFDDIRNYVKKRFGK